MMKNVIKRAFSNTLPVMAGYLVLAVGFGVIMQSKGYGIIVPLLMSLFIYAGSMQYLAIDLISGGASLIATALTTLAVNARHLFYGISMVGRYKNVGRAKPYLVFALTDETYSLVCDGKEKDKKYYFFVSLFNHTYWVVGTLLGALLGTVTNFNTNGIDFALTALFITVFVEQWLNTKKHIYAVIGVVSSLFCLFVFGKDNFLIPAMLLITIALAICKKVGAKDE